VKRYACLIYRQIGAHNAHGAVAIALRTGLVPMNDGY